MSLLPLMLMTLQVTQLGSNYATLDWEAPAETCSNRVTLSEIRITPGNEGTAIKTIDFSALSANGNWLDVSEDIGKYYPELSGDRLYAPASSSGILQISTRREKGELRVTPLVGNAIAITAAQTSGDTSTLAMDLIDGTQTNRLSTTRLDDSYTRIVTENDKYTDNAALVIHEASEYKSNRRILIDQLEFLSGYTPEQTTTNRIISVCLYPPAIFPLRSAAVYLVEVTYFDTNGEVLDYESVKFETKRHDQPFQWLITSTSKSDKLPSPRRYR